MNYTLEWLFTWVNAARTEAEFWRRFRAVCAVYGLRVRATPREAVRMAETYDATR
jgi:hypothetical protein